MPGLTSHDPTHVELLTFLSDANSQVRQVALSNLVPFSARNSPHRSLLTEKHLGKDGKPLKGRDGKDVDTIEDLKRLCRDQPLTAHNALSALVNLTDSLLVSRRVGDAAFLEFLVSYIADPVSLLADLACMLLSNLTKLESIGTTLLSLRVKSRPFYSFVSSADLDALVDGMDADPAASGEAGYEAQRAKAMEHAARVAEKARKGEEMVPAMSRLLDAFEEGASVESGGAEKALEEMRKRAAGGAAAAAAQATSSVERDAEGRARIKRRSNCHFLASVFANITIIPAGREWFVTPLSTSSAATSASAQAAVAAAERGSASSDALPPPASEYPVARILAYTEHPDLIRRGGVISSLKNVLFIKSAHQMLVAPPPPREGEDPMLAGALRATSRPPSSLDILPYILLPLISGSEMASVDIEDQEALPEECQMLDEDKKRESDAALRLMLVECLLLLCTALYGRQVCRSRGVYVVVREAHAKESDEKIAEAVLRLVNILKRDESDSTARDDGLADDDAAEEEGEVMDIEVIGGAEDADERAVEEI